MENSSKQLKEIKTDEKENTTNSKYNNSKELLIKLLKEKLDSRIIKLEKRHKTHISIMKLTTGTIDEITEWANNANKQIKEKLKKDKEKSSTQLKQTKLKPKNSVPMSSKTYTKTKTPLRMKMSKTFLIQEDSKKDLNRTSKSNKSYINKNVSSKTLGNRTKSFSFLNKEKKKNKQNNLNIYGNGNEYLRRPSIISNKSSKSNKTSMTSKTPKSKKSIIKVSKNGITPVRRKTPFKKRNVIATENTEIHSMNNIKNLSTSQSKENYIKSSEIINSNIDMHQKAMEELNMNKMESAIQKDDLLNNDDPLLVAPLTDLDFPNFKLSNSNTLKSTISELETFNYNYEKNFDDKLYKKISDYLSLIDLIQFKNISKNFNKLFFVYISNKLKEDKIFFINKKKKLDENDIPENLSFKDFVISKGSTKAIKLLNEPSLNHLFYEDTPADNGRIIIYRIFFQLINHPYKYIPKDKKEEFWKKCKNYFSNEIKGKTGELLQKTLDDKMIDIEGDNLYKLYKLVENDLDKVYPTYYSKICGTTGLFCFFIKDILDFVGISNDEKINSKAYWTYTKIIDSLENKINHIKSLKNI